MDGSAEERRAGSPVQPRPRSPPSPALQLCARRGEDPAPRPRHTARHRLRETHRVVPRRLRPREPAGPGAPPSRSRRRHAEPRSAVEGAFTPFLHRPALCAGPSRVSADAVREGAPRRNGAPCLQRPPGRAEAPRHPAQVRRLCPVERAGAVGSVARLMRSRGRIWGSRWGKGQVRAEPRGPLPARHPPRAVTPGQVLREPWLKAQQRQHLCSMDVTLLVGTSKQDKEAKEKDWERGRCC